MSLKYSIEAFGDLSKITDPLVLNDWRIQHMIKEQSMTHRENFDPNIPENWGRPLYWSPGAHIDAIIGMIRADELVLALKMCDQVPAWYRENPLQEIAEIKRKLYQQTYDAMEYAHDADEANCSREFGENQFSNGYMYPRADIASKLCDDANRVFKVPWFFDLGCSHGNLPLGLIKAGYTFKYCGAAINQKILSKVKAWVGESWLERPEPDHYKVLWCTEVLEHCFDEQSVVHGAYKIGVGFDEIILSVPLGCLGGGLPDWDTRRMGHVRGYTQKEFIEFADKNFPGYMWSVARFPSMVIVGKKK